jgi:hypothetical protein
MLSMQNHHLPHSPTPIHGTHEAETQPSPPQIALHCAAASYALDSKCGIPTNLASIHPADRIVINRLNSNPILAAAPPKIPSML